MIKQTNFITVAVKEGGIVEDTTLELASFNVRKLKMEDDILSFQTMVGDEERDAEGNIKYDQLGNVIVKNRRWRKVEVLKDNILILIIDGVKIYPKSDEEVQDVDF